MPTWCSQCGRMISDVINPGGDTESICGGCASSEYYDGGWYTDDPVEVDPTRCPVCGGDLVPHGGWLYCSDKSCGWSLRVGDSAGEEADR